MIIRFMAFLVLFCSVQSRKETRIPNIHYWYVSIFSLFANVKYLIFISSLLLYTFDQIFHHLGFLPTITNLGE